MVTSMSKKTEPNGNGRSYFKGYIVTVADDGISFAQNYSSLSRRDARSSRNIIPLKRSATVLPILSFPQSPSTASNTNNSSNSAFSSQDDTPQTQTSRSSQGNQVTNSHVKGQVVDGLQGIGQQMSSDDLKQFERKLEREREKRLHNEPPPVRIDSRALSENVPSCDFNMRRNGFRPTSKNSFMTRGEQNVTVASFRHTHAPPTASSIDPLNSLSTTNSGPIGGIGGGAPKLASSSGAPGMLRGQSIGFGSREGLATSGLNGSGSGAQGRLGKARRSYLIGQNEKNRQNQYQFQDPVSGATSDFQQRLSELTTLESDTIRYERTKKAKKKAKQDSG